MIPTIVLKNSWRNSSKLNSDQGFRKGEGGWVGEWWALMLARRWGYSPCSRSWLRYVSLKPIWSAEGGGNSPCIGEPTSSSAPWRASIKAHPTMPHYTRPTDGDGLFSG